MVDGYAVDGYAAGNSGVSFRTVRSLRCYDEMKQLGVAVKLCVALKLDITKTSKAEIGYNRASKAEIYMIMTSKAEICETMVSKTENGYNKRRRRKSI